MSSGGVFPEGARATWQGRLHEAAVERLAARPGGTFSCAEVASMLEGLARGLEECRRLESLVHRRLPLVPPASERYVMSFAERSLPGSLSLKVGPDGRLFEISPGRRLVASCAAEPALLKARPVTEEGWRVDAYDLLPDGRILVAGRADQLGQELRLLTELSHGVWSGRSISYETGIVTAISCAPGGAVCFTSSRGVGCIRGVASPLPILEWFGDAAHQHVSLDYLQDGRLVVGAREGIYIWTLLGDAEPIVEFVGTHPCPFDDDLAQPVIVRALAGGEIATCDQFGTVRVWHYGPRGMWSAALNDLPRGPVCSIIALPDGGFVSVSENGLVERTFPARELSGRVVGWSTKGLFDMRLHAGFSAFAETSRSFANANGQVLPSGRIVFFGGGMGTGGIRCVFDPEGAGAGGAV